MREILFKAKRLSDGEWVEGYYAFMKPYHYIMPEDSYDAWYEINPETLCQYTGLYDKNGNKIWENDVVRGHGNKNDLYKVIFGEFYIIDVESLENVDSAIGWHTEVIETDAISKTKPFCLPMPLTEFYINRSEFEVIGNIFDNPDLLKR